jgi:hypothetical protein
MRWLRLFQYLEVYYYCTAFVLIVLGLSGCQVYSQATSTSIAPTLILTPTNAVVLASTPDSGRWQEDWLKGIPCRPPCWEQITPGKTNASEAVKILRQVSYISSDSVTISVSSLVPEIGEINWKWIGNQEHGGASFDGNTTQQIVRRIGLGFSQRILLKDVIQAYGQPTHIAVRAGYEEPGSVASSIQIVYASQGFWIDTVSPRDIGPDLWLNSVSLFSPGIDNFAQLFPEYKDNPTLLVPWQGYQNFAFYCRDEYEGKACREAK